MAKPKMYGYNKQCIPNNRADAMRNRRVAKHNEDWTYQHGCKIQLRAEKIQYQEIVRMKEAQLNESV